MSTTSKSLISNSFGFASPKSSSTCNICTRLLYSFEEILICRICHGSYHWRCAKPETISHYGENAHFICDKCNDNITTTTPNSNHRLSNGSGIRIKSPDSSETDYRNFASIPSKLNTTPIKDTAVVNAVRYFEEKQQQHLPSTTTTTTHKTSKSNEFNGHLSSQTNGQYTDDSKINHRIQQESDDENLTTGMFQANYQYTPLKEYAAMKTNRIINDTTTTNGYQNSSSSTTPISEHQLTSRFNGIIHYTNNKSPTHFTSPTIDNLTVHNRQQNFVSSTNLNVNEISSRRQQFNQSTPYLTSQIRDNESPTFQSSSQLQPQQQQTDRHSNVGSDSGIVMINHQHPPTPSTFDDNPLIEKKLTDLVQQLGKQLETDAQKLSEKLELKLKNLEYMIHQQTYIIRRQDDVIERLKTKILKIESERDHFRERLSIHEQREQDEKKNLITTTTIDRKLYEQDDIPTNRKFSTTSSGTTEHSSRRSSKKTPAPRMDPPRSTINHENESTLSKLIKTVPTNQENLVSDSSTPTINKLISSNPTVEKPAASTRLDDIIHQSNTNNNSERNSPSTYYNTTESDQHKLKPKRSSSSSSSSSSAASSASTHGNKYNLPSSTHTEFPPKNPNYHRSLESIQRKTPQTERTLTSTNKTTSLEFGKRPVEYDDPGSIYIIPQEVNHPATQYQDAIIKGWLRKQNRDSFFKRIERYYCVLSKNILLMHKHENDTKPQKAITLRGAKVVQYEDQRFGPSLELTWSRRSQASKRYNLYAPNAQEAQQWLNGIQTAIQNLDTKNLQTIKDASEGKWQSYRMQT